VHTRNNWKHPIESGSLVDNLLLTDIQAATTIQANYRGHRTRKDIEKTKASVDRGTEADGKDPVVGAGKL